MLALNPAMYGIVRIKSFSCLVSVCLVITITLKYFVCVGVSLQVFTHISYPPSSLIQASHYSSLYMVKMMRLKVKVSISVCVGFLYTVDVSIPSLSLFNKQSKKGSLLSSSDSMVNFIEGLTEFKWSNKIRKTSLHEIYLCIFYCMPNLVCHYIMKWLNMDGM